MGARPHKNKKKNHRRQPIGRQASTQTRPESVATQINREVAPAAAIAVTKPAKSGTIAAIDYFGFPVSVFGADLKRTGWATLVILVILGVITIAVRVS